ncbi:MAG: transcription elongation factor GreA [Lachnospiraceae bacterium]
MAEKKNLLTREGLKKYEDELQELKSVRRKEISQKIKEAREQGDLSENAEYDAAKDEQRDVEARIEELEKLLKNVEVVDVVEQVDGKVAKVSFGCTVKLLDKEMKEEVEYTIKGASEADSLNGSISNESPLGRALIGSKKGDTVEVEAPVGVIKYKVLEIRMDN